MRRWSMDRSKSRHGWGSVGLAEAFVHGDDRYQPVVDLDVGDRSRSLSPAEARLLARKLISFADGATKKCAQARKAEGGG